MGSFNPFKKSSWKSVGHAITHVAYQAGDAVKDVGYQAGDVAKGVTQQALALASSIPVVGPLVNTGLGLVLSIPAVGPFLGKTLGFVPPEELPPLPEDATLMERLEYWILQQDPVMQEIIVYGGIAIAIYIAWKLLMAIINLLFRII